MTNEELQALAAELSSLDRDTDNGRARAIESAIVEYELGLLKDINGRAHFPLTQLFNGKIPSEDFYSIFTDVVMWLIRRYDNIKTSITKPCFLR